MPPVAVRTPEPGAVLEEVSVPGRIPLEGNWKNIPGGGNSSSSRTGEEAGGRRVSGRGGRKGRKGGRVETWLREATELGLAEEPCDGPGGRWWY